MSVSPADSFSILLASREAGLRDKLLLQISKDYSRAGLDPPFTRAKEGAFPADAEILDHLKFSVYRLLMEDFEAYMNLMYASDVGESAFREMEAADPVAASDEVVFFLLKRQWQKVRLRARYDSGSP